MAQTGIGIVARRLAFARCSAFHLTQAPPEAMISPGSPVLAFARYHRKGTYMLANSTPRDLFRACVTFQSGARPLLTQTNWLMPGVKESWIEEGATEAEIEALFALSDNRGRNVAISSGVFPPQPIQILYEDDDTLVQTNELGGVEKLNKRYASLPLPVEFPVQGPADWAAYRERLLWAPERLSAGWVSRAWATLDEGLPLGISFWGFWGFPRQLLGDERLCLAYYDDPEMVRDMCETYCALALRIADEIDAAGVPIDKVFFWEDMAGKQGSLIGPHTFREFMTPYYQQIIRRFRKLGAYHIEVDTDGNIEGLLPLFLEAGVTCLFPFECQAGMDIVRVRERYPQLVIHGGIDKRVLAQGREAIDRELNYKLPPMIETGGYLCAADHRIILGTTYTDMRYFMERVTRMIA